MLTTLRWALLMTLVEVWVIGGRIRPFFRAMPTSLPQPVLRSQLPLGELAVTSASPRARGSILSALPNPLDSSYNLGIEDLSAPDKPRGASTDVRADLEVASPMNEDMIVEARILFRVLDKNGDGQVTRNEVKFAMARSRTIRTILKLGSYKDCSMLVNRADTDGDGLMSFNEFATYLQVYCLADFEAYVDMVKSARPEVSREKVTQGWRKEAPPREEKNAQLLILREDRKREQLYVLLQQRSYELERMPGHIAAVGGKFDSSDPNSAVTAVREAAEETGLLDLWPLGGAPRWLLRDLVGYEIELPAPPQSFLKFDEGNNVDWWVLLLQGSGTFTAARDASDCADIASILGLIPGAVAAPCFGHFWMPVGRIHEIPDAIPKMGGLQYKVRDAVAALQQVERQKKTNSWDR